MRRWLPAASAVARRPGLWPVAAREVWRLRRPGWARRAPFLPLPDADWVRWRLSTAYGDDAAPDGRDLVVWLDWRRRFEVVVGR